MFGHGDSVCGVKDVGMHERYLDLPVRQQFGEFQADRLDVDVMGYGELSDDGEAILFPWALSFGSANQTFHIDVIFCQTGGDRGKVSRHVDARHCQNKRCALSGWGDRRLAARQNTDGRCSGVVYFFQIRANGFSGDAGLKCGHEGDDEITEPNVLIQHFNVPAERRNGAGEPAHQTHPVFANNRNGVTGCIFQDGFLRKGYFCITYFYCLRMSIDPNGILNFQTLPFKA